MRKVRTASVLLFVLACGGETSAPVPSGTPPPPPPPVSPPPAPVSIVVVTPDNVGLVPLQTAPLSAVTRDGAGNPLAGRTIAWSSTAPATASVDANGLVSATAPGSATIIAASEGKSGSAAITVRDGAYLGPTGGQAATASGNVTLIVPVGALGSPAPITIAALQNPPGDPNLAPGTAYDFGPSGIQFGQPVTIKVKYDPGLLRPAADQTQLRLAKLVGTSWIPLAGSSVEVASRTVTGQTNSFSTYGIIEIPPAFRLAIAASAFDSLLPPTATLLLAVRDASGQLIGEAPTGWSSSDPSVLEVSADGWATARALGGTEVTASFRSATLKRRFLVSTDAPPAPRLEWQPAWTCATFTPHCTDPSATVSWVPMNGSFFPGLSNKNYYLGTVVVRNAPVAVTANHILIDYPATAPCQEDCIFVDYPPRRLDPAFVPGADAAFLACFKIHGIDGDPTLLEHVFLSPTRGSQLIIQYTGPLARAQIGFTVLLYGVYAGNLSGNC